MLEQVSDQIRLCYERANEAKERAEATDDPTFKAEYLAAESRWLTLARSYGFSESLEDFTTANADQRRRFDERLQQSNAPVAEVRKSLDRPDDIVQLHEISTLLIQEGNLDFLYNRIIDAAVNLMSSDMASMQLLDERSQLRLLAWKGFHPQSAIFWETVYLDSACTCGLAMSTGCRVVVPDIETDDSMADTADLEEYRRSNIRSVQSTPLVSRSGQLLGMISTHWREPHQPAEHALLRLDVLARQAADLIERTRAEVALRESNENLRWLASIVESSGDSIITKDLDGIITTWNKSAEQLFGYTTEEVIGQPGTVLIPRDRQHEEPRILKWIRAGKKIEHYETVRQHKDGSLIDISLCVSPIRDDRGIIIGASKIARAITERKKIERQVAVLAREAEHRTRNILATVSATVDLSQSDTPAGLKAAIRGRIQALANAHALFVESRWTGAELSRLAAQELSPYQTSGERAQVEGPETMLDPAVAQALAVTVHELATNAAKYGALSTPEGRIHMAWSRSSTGSIAIRWTEQDGPPVTPPTRNGFGSRVMNTLIQQIGGTIAFDWRHDGLRCDVTVPSPQD